MGFKFRKSIKVAPGVKVNLSRKGVGVSAGVKGARVSTGPAGTRITTSIPGSGLSYEHRVGKKKGSQNQSEQHYQKQEHHSQIFEVIPIRIKDNKANTVARKMMMPFAVLMGVITVVSLLLAQFILAVVCGIIGFFCYKNIKVPVGVTCPSCNRQQPLLFKQKEIQCLKCKSTLVIK
ncbi:hypothetical protein IE3_05533 [Bacillus cereus BAG3X2-1]|uniref:DUF4236 domain-containing protein n=1 Tax=Bacillus cereus group TaxID=86661 RepID=UPI000278FF03|nr:MULTISPECIES: DUF4236 domain-containing protein [Bacillus cereus group]EJQ03162.1 hypothetical protein IE3_05533 [Bacillus cereus BAG3X2-1]PEA18064.1 DUF4236 domain-containing protein [Bacillus cereus]PFB93112.1 DUF4236 domain-containing protein [Bacillus cereus]PFI41012.1 DUF4236 domain-containing protein [Bacillus cereus]PFL13714.1 DUF4236 domain-containing protein [Bacillus cereus]